MAEDYGAGTLLEAMDSYEVAQLSEGMEDYVVVVEENMGSCSHSYQGEPFQFGKEMEVDRLCFAAAYLYCGPSKRVFSC